MLMDKDLQSKIGNLGPIGSKSLSLPKNSWNGIVGTRTGTKRKLTALRALGIDPYPAARFPSHILLQLRPLLKKIKTWCWPTLMSRRIQGKASFAELQDSTGRIQLYFNRDKICPNEDKTLYNEVYKKLLDIGDIIGVRGTLFTTQVGNKL